MRKKSLVVLAMAAAMVFGGAMTAHAEETQWYTELSEYGLPMDHVKENTAQVDAWAERHKGNIADISNIEERYVAVVNEVVNFLDYDVNYMSPSSYYTIRDQRGVCGDYTLLLVHFVRKWVLSMNMYQVFSFRPLIQFLRLILTANGDTVTLLTDSRQVSAD